jgi:hypothetical protein
MLDLIKKGGLDMLKKIGKYVLILAIGIGVWTSISMPAVSANDMAQQFSETTRCEKQVRSVIGPFKPKGSLWNDIKKWLHW